LKRLLALLTGLVVLPLVAPARPAEALGVAGCTIGGSISFAPPSQTVAKGTWRIDRGAINCQGFFKATDRFIGQGGFTGSGTYEVLPSGAGTCVALVGTGEVDYLIKTVAGTYEVREASQFVSAGAGTGKIATPSLRGTFLVPPPYEGGDCVTKPVKRAGFTAQVLLVRDPQIGVASRD
jgi:hypothetical protein